jgi:hypothetical protein
MKRPRPCRPPSVPPTPVVTPRASLSPRRSFSDVPCRFTGVPTGFPLPMSPRAARHLAMRVSRSARFTRSAGFLSLVRRQARFAPNAFRRPSVLTRASSRQCIFALTRPGFTIEDPAPVSPSSFCFSHGQSRRRVIRVSRASPPSPEGLPFESLQRTVLQARRVDVCSPPSFVCQRRAPASRWRPVSSWACAHFSPVELLVSRRATPREACRRLEHESIVLSRTRSPTEPLDVPSRPWSLSLPASLPETSSPFSSRAREPHEVSRTRTPSADETSFEVPLRGLSPTR